MITPLPFDDVNNLTSSSYLIMTDAYMGVTNLVENQIHDHVKHIAEFAIDMVHEASQILIDEDEPERGFIQIRVGVSGLLLIIVPVE